MLLLGIRSIERSTLSLLKIFNAPINLLERTYYQWFKTSG